MTDVHTPSTWVGVDVWTPPSAQEERLHALVSRLDDLLVMRTMEQARAAGARRGLALGDHNVLKALEDEIARLRDAIRDPIDHDPDPRHKAALLVGTEVGLHPNSREYSAQSAGSGWAKSICVGLRPLPQRCIKLRSGIAITGRVPDAGFQ